MAKDFAPWSAETDQGIKTDPVDSNISVRQEVVPAVNVGTISTLTGEWVGVPTSDEIFSAVTTHVNVANGAETLSPDTGQENHIDMTGYASLFIALKPTRGGDVRIDAVMGPDTNAFGNLTPVNAAAILKGDRSYASTGTGFQNLVSDTSETLTVDVWNIFMLTNTLNNQKNLQFKITNNSGDVSTIEFAYMRLV